MFHSLKTDTVALYPFLPGPPLSHEMRMCSVHNIYSDVVKDERGPMIISLSILPLKYILNLHILAIHVIRDCDISKKICANLFPALSTVYVILHF